MALHFVVHWTFVLKVISAVCCRCFIAVNSGQCSQLPVRCRQPHAAEKRRETRSDRQHGWHFSCHWWNLRQRVRSFDFGSLLVYVHIVKMCSQGYSLCCVLSHVTGGGVLASVGWREVWRPSPPRWIQEPLVIRDRDGRPPWGTPGSALLLCL